MADLMRGLIQVKDPLTLFAFVSLVFLVAFRTKKVPELFFGLAKEKLTKERYSRLLHRFMLYGFIGFVLLCGSAVTGQVLALKTQAKPLTLDDLRAELKNRNLSEGQRQTAENSYSEGIAYIQQRDFDRAIQSLQSSINAVPSLAAEYTLAYLYQKKGDAANSSTHAAAAQSLANRNGDSLAQLRLEQLAATGSAQSARPGLIGEKATLPQGGASFEDARPISPGLYISTEPLNGNQYRYFKLRLKAGQVLLVDFRVPDVSNMPATAGATVYDSNGAPLKESHIIATRSGVGSVQWNASIDSTLYLSVGSEYGNGAGTVYRISIQ